MVASTFAKRQDNADFPEDIIIGALRQGRFEEAVSRFRNFQEAARVCPSAACGGETCCAHHLEGRLWYRALFEKNGEYAELARRLKRWIEEREIHAPRNGEDKVA
ncbi:MAG: hypothetical protein QF511_02595 [Rhodospirillales bacterium]|jgi:hypothetical protein|nr:hypothetical protein [Rhodospirillales bacterium]MDP7097402.1 hypothetical protein [Rhodospirillales bacterium]MDP7215687.1 hypothetical protein [Rhodospirillales bacterium]HIJ44386.1 hypothetical protein [Rhodospirillaceae bacterium]